VRTLLLEASDELEAKKCWHDMATIIKTYKRQQTLSVSLEATGIEPYIRWSVYLHKSQ